MNTPEPPAGSEHYRAGWRHGYEQAAIDRERSDDATGQAREEERFRYLASLSRGWDSYDADMIDPACIDRARAVLTALRGPVSISGTVRGGIFLTWQDEHVTFEIDPGGRLTASVGDDYASSDLDEPAAPTRAVPDTGQAREQILQRDSAFGAYVIAVCDAIGLPHHSPLAAVVEAIRAAVTAAQAPGSPTDSTPKSGRCGSSDTETTTGTVQAREPVGAITLDAIAWYCTACGALRSAPTGAITTTACACGSSLMTGRGVGRALLGTDTTPEAGQ